MKELVIISGKGGTGKTSITASLASLSTSAVLADCDVDAADLHLILMPRIIHQEVFMSGNEAEIDPDLCNGCGICAKICRFGAIEKLDENGKKSYKVNPYSCEGCGVCVWNCPQKAISFDPRRCGEWYCSKTRYGTMVHAALGIGAENSGKLVSMVRQKAKSFAGKEGADYLLIDGPPGTGCPVIASITGTDAVLLVTEPTVSGFHDLDRIIQLTQHFGIKAFVCINKYGLNDEMCDKIMGYCKDHGIEIVGKIDYSGLFTKAQINGQSIVEYAPEDKVAKTIEIMWQKIIEKF